MVLRKRDILMNRMDRNSLGLADRVASVETVIAVAIVERLIAKAYLDGVNWMITKPLIAAESLSAVNALVAGGQDASSTIQS